MEHPEISTKTEITRHWGWISISEELLLGYLDYKGGSVISGEFIPERRVLRILIEHPSMPAVEPGFHCEDVFPTYKRVRRTKKHPAGLVRVGTYA